jgi:hypothetical protein
MQRLDVGVVLCYCGLSNDATGAFDECLQSGRGPVELFGCNIDIPTLARALTGNSRVTKLKPYHPYPMGTNDVDVAILVAALANNRGLVNLDLQYSYISDDNWIILCESMKAHPTLTNLDLFYTSPGSPTNVRIVQTDDQKAHRTRLLAEMMQENTSMHTVELSDNEREEKIYTEEILPYLETNRYRPRVLAIKKTIARPFREKVLGRALFCVKSNPNLVWMFLSENVDALVCSFGGG